MPSLKILLYPDTRLRKKSAPVGKVDDGIHLLLDDMAETMRNAEGIGLSAPQVGKNIRVIIVCDAEDEEKPEEKNLPESASETPVIEMINPVIKNSSGGEYGTEGCLSIPGFSAGVKRKESVEVEWLNRNGDLERTEKQGLTARIIQHEIDHLDGILFVDRLSRLKREMMLKDMDRTFLRD